MYVLTSSIGTLRVRASYYVPKRQLFIMNPPRDGKDFKGFLPQMDEFYFTTADFFFLEYCRCIVPNFMND